MTDRSQELQVKAMKAEGSAQELNGKASRMVPVNVRLPAHVYEQLANEAERRSEDMAVTLRRHITSGMTRDQMDARLDEIDRKLESLLDGDPTAQLEAYKKLVEVVLDMKTKLDTVVVAQVSVKASLAKLTVHYNAIVDHLDGKKAK